MMTTAALPSQILRACPTLAIPMGAVQAVNWLPMVRLDTAEHLTLATYTSLPPNMVDPVSKDILELQHALRAFAEERDWKQFHSPKNLAISVTLEASEVLEHFQWITEEQSRQLDANKRQAVANEIADVLLYLLQLSDSLGIDPMQAAKDKLAINAAKYPVEKAKGNSKKYTEF